MRKTHRAFVLGLCVCVPFLPARADDLGVDVIEPAEAEQIWSVAEGLPSDAVTAIVQTRDGFLWVGTSAGLVRFDGVKFTAVSLAPGATNNPGGVTALCEDSHGALWVGTQADGLFELTEGRVAHFSRADKLADNNVTSLAADGRGGIWVGCNSGLSLWDGRQFRSFGKTDGLPDESVSGVHVARSGAVWITTRAGMGRFIEGKILPYAFQTESEGRSPEYLGAYEDQRGNLWAFGDTYLINLAEGQRFNYFRNSEPGSVRIWSLCEGRDGRLWIGTSGRGLFCFEEGRFRPINLGESRTYDVRAICEDREGDLWLGTSGGGLVQLRPQTTHVLRAAQGLPQNPATALAIEPGERVCVGLQRVGLFIGESGRFDRAGAGNATDSENLISSVCVGGDGSVWMGTLGHGLRGVRNGRAIHLTTADGLASDMVLAVCADLDGAIWASTSAGTVHRVFGESVTRFDEGQGLPTSAVTAMAPAGTGGLWMGTRDGRILREEKEKFMEVEAAHALVNRPVLALHEGEGARLWIGLAGGGLACMANGRTMSWNTNQGLPSDTIAGVVEDEAKNLWLATGAGIYRVNRNEVEKVCNDSKLPLTAKMVSAAKSGPDAAQAAGGPCAALAPDGQMWFATADGVLEVETRQARVEPASFPVYIESAAINGKAAMPLLQGGPWPAASAFPKIFMLPVDTRSVDFRFTAMSFASPDDVQFRHKLEGSDTEWVDDGTARSARYGRLTFGNYRFVVQARAANGTWREAAAPFAFLVPTPLYYQTWAICVYALAAVGLIAGIVREISHRRFRFTLARLEQQQALERERMRIARDMHDEMGSKLTKISFLSEHAQMDSGASGPLADKIQSIAQASRELLQTMDEIVWVVNPLNDTLDHLVAYLGHYAVEYFQNTSVECEMRLPQDVPHHALSSETRHNLFLAFEETLNNVLKHSQATSVRVEMAMSAAGFELVVTDNGKGFATAGPAGTKDRTTGRGGNGLNNMHERLEAAGGECLVESKPGGGTTVTLRIPLDAQAEKP